MSLDEDHLDEIFTNNNTDEDCFQVVLERYKVNGDFKHDWEEIIGVLRKIGEEPLADEVCDHVNPCKLYTFRSLREDFMECSAIYIVFAPHAVAEDWFS